MSSNRFRPAVLLGTQTHVMQWNPVLNIYRVNRYAVLSPQEKAEKLRYDYSRLDFLEAFLCRNLDHCAELVFSYFSFQELLDCQLVNKTWHDFIGTQVFKKRLELLVSNDDSLEELADLEGWNNFLFRPLEQVEDPHIYKSIYAKMLLLKDMWRCREPKAKRLFCDSFVLSVRSDDAVIFCGLNNGCVQAWDISYLGKIREQECHEKGVKCIEINTDIIITGSYDTLIKLWRRDTWELISDFDVHADSVWDMKLHGTVLGSAGLDGTIVIFDFVSTYELQVRSRIPAHGELVSAVDFNQTFLIAGFEDAAIGVWDMPTGRKVHSMLGHNGGVTGIQLQFKLAATSSYDTQVRVWDVEHGTCLLVLADHDTFARCVGFTGTRIVSGDFGGNIFLWDLTVQHDNEKWSVKLKNSRKWQCHKGHVVCIQVNARRIISGSRDRTLMINDFWLKTVDSLGVKKESGAKYSRFLKRDIYDY